MAVPEGLCFDTIRIDDPQDKLNAAVLQIPKTQATLLVEVRSFGLMGTLWVVS